MAKLDAMSIVTKFGPSKIRLAVDAEECERDFSTFFRRSWQSFDPSSYMHNWHIDAISDHLMAVVDGSIRRLLINVPPRCSKTTQCTIAFPAWVWTLKTNPEYPLHGPTSQFLCVTYGSVKAKEDAVTCRRLIASPWYQDRWGRRVRIAKDRDNSERFDTTVGGSRISTGIEATVLGRGGNIKIIDDAMKPDDPESELSRARVLRQYDETLSSRENDPRIAAEIIVAQRLAETDLPGHVLTKYGSDPDNGGFCHLMIPAEYDHKRHCITSLGWQDPRGSIEAADGSRVMLPEAGRKRYDGTSFWPERFSSSQLDRRKTAEGPFSWAAKYQQEPVPRGGGIIKAEWWQLWRGDSLPSFSFVLVSVDTAHTESELNDESGITVWGVFSGERNVPQIMLIDAWEGRHEISQLVHKIASMCKTYQADVCLVEAKANGIDCINEIRRLYGRREWSTLPFDPKGDKVARLKGVQPSFSGEYRTNPENNQGEWMGNGVVWAPDRDYAQLTIDRVANFPMGAKKAIVDTTSQGITWLRTNGHILTHEEVAADEEEELRYEKPTRAPYDV